MHVAALAALLLAAPAPSPGAPPARAVPLATEAALLRAEDRRVADDAVRGALADARPAVRARGLAALARIGTSDLAPLTAAVADADPAVRAAAVWGLGHLKSPAGLAAVTRAAGDPDATVRLRAADALARLPEGAGAEALGRLLRDADPRVRGRAALAAWRFPDPAIAVDPLLALLAAGETRWEAAYALARLGSAGLAGGPGGASPAPSDGDRGRIREALLPLSRDRDPGVRMLAARGLAAPGQGVELETLSRLALDPDPRVRVQALRSMGRPGGAFDISLRKALSDPDLLVVSAALEALGRIRTPAAVEAIASGLPSAPTPWLRVVGLDALTQADPERAASLAALAETDPDERVRAAFARALTGRPEPRARRVLEQLLRDPSPSVQAAAVTAHAGTKGPLPAGVAALAGSTDPVVRAAVAECAGLHLPPGASGEEASAALGALRAVWERSAGDPVPDARLEVVRAAGKAGRSEESRALLLAALGDPDRLVRAEAAAALKAGFGEDHAAKVGAAVDRPVARYEEILKWAEAPRRAVVTVEKPGAAPVVFTLDLDAAAAPLTAWNFAQLAEKKFFDGLSVHRVVPNFVLQGGDPRGDGNGGPGWSIRDELRPDGWFGEGALGMATSGPDTAGSQWFVTHSPQPHLEGTYTVFGHLEEPVLPTVWRIHPFDRILSVRMD